MRLWSQEPPRTVALNEKSCCGRLRTRLPYHGVAVATKQGVRSSEDLNPVVFAEVWRRHVGAGRRRRHIGFHDARIHRGASVDME